MTQYRFWVASSRMTSYETLLDIDDWGEDVEHIKSLLEEWCREVFPMFDFTDAYVKYGYEKVNNADN